MAATESKSNSDIFHPSYCEIQSDWDLSLSLKNNNSNNTHNEESNSFWISLNKYNDNDNDRLYINGKVKINNDDNKNDKLTSDLIINKNNDYNLDWKMDLCPYNINKNKNNYWYGNINCVNNDNKLLKDYKMIPFYQRDKICTSSIKCIDVAKSSYFKRWYICAGLENGDINIIDIESNKLKMKCNKSENIGGITSAKFFPFGDLILSGDTKGILSIYAIADPKGKPAVTFNGHKADITCIDFLNEGSEILSGAYDSTIIRWNCSTQKQVINYGKLGLSKINQIGLIQDDKILISSSTDGYLTFYDVKNGKEINKINVSNECFTTFNDNKTLITTNENGLCYIYDIRNLNGSNTNCIGKIQRNQKLIKKMIKYDENEIILYNPSGSIWKWNIDISTHISNVNTLCEWTGNDTFGINDVVLMNGEQQDRKLFVATKNNLLLQYPLL